MKTFKKNILVLSLLCALSANVHSVEPPVFASRFNTKNLLYMAPVTAVGIGALCIYALYNYLTQEWEGDIFRRACHDGDLEEVQKMLEEVEDINTATYDTHWRKDCPPIHFAVTTGTLEALKWMVEEKGADINKVYTYRKLGRCGCCCGGVVHDEPVTRCPLSLACVRGDLAIVEYLIEKGANINERCSVTRDETEYTYSPLYAACQKGHLPVVKLLLGKGARLEVNNVASPLHVAAAGGHTEVVEELLRRNRRLVNVKSGRGQMTALHRVVSSYEVESEKRISTVRVLLRYGADVNAKDIGNRTPLHMGYKKLDMKKILVENGADVNAIDNYGETPLMKACHDGHRWFGVDRCDPKDKEIVKYLISKGADVNVINNENKTALDLACSGRRQDIVELLISHGAEVRYWHIRREEERRHSTPQILEMLKAKMNEKRDLDDAIKGLAEKEEEQEIITARDTLRSKMENAGIAPFAKKSALPQLLELHRQKAEVMPEEDLKQYFGKVAFDKKFLEEERFKDVIEFARQKKIADINGQVL